MATLSEGLEQLSRGLVDVIILDLGLPDSQGLETLRAVHKHAPRLPIIVLTVSNAEELARKAMEEGAQRFLSKNAVADNESYAEIFTSMIRYAIEEKRAEAALKSSEEHFETLFDYSPIAQMIYDACGHPTRVNKAMLAFLGIADVADFGGLTIFTTQRMSEASRAKLRAGHTVRYEQHFDFEAIRASGDFPTTRSDARDADVHVAPLFDAAGTVEGYLTQMTDITERKRAETELESIAKFPEENPHPILRLTPERGILYANAASDMLVRDWGGRHGDQVRSQAADACRTRKICTLDVTLGTLTFQLTLVPLAEEGYVNIYGTNIAARKHAEESLKRAFEKGACVRN